MSRTGRTGETKSTVHRPQAAGDWGFDISGFKKGRGGKRKFGKQKSEMANGEIGDATGGGSDRGIRITIRIRIRTERRWRRSGGGGEMVEANGVVEAGADLGIRICDLRGSGARGCGGKREGRGGVSSVE